MRLALCVLAFAVAVSGCSTGGTGHATVTSEPAPSLASAPSTTMAPCALRPTEDLIEWDQRPGIEPSAILIGNVDYSKCAPTAETFASEEPTGPGDCSELAPASANPGYDIDAVPAPAPRGVIEEVGQGCDAG